MTTEAGQRRLDADEPSKGRLLIVDDNRDFATALSNLLALEGYEVDLAHDGDAARAALERFDAEVVLLDLRLEAGSGFDLMAPLKEQYPGLVFVIITGYAETEAAVEALRRGAYDFLRKPFDDGELLTVLERALERTRLEKAKLAAERVIAEKSALLETTFESMSQGMTVYDADLKLIGFNQKYIEILGYPADFIRLGKPFEEIARFRAERGEYGPGDAEKLAAKSLEAARQGKAMRDELTRPDGAVFAIRRDPLPDGGFVTTLTDITERKKAEEEVAEKSAVLETTFENMSQGIRVLDADLKLVACNSKFIELHDYPPEFIRLGMPLEDFVRFRAERGDRGPVDVEEHVRKRVLEKRRGVADRRENKLPNGRTALAYHEPMPNGGWVSTYTDITERKQAQDELAEKAAVLET
ncbi:MAG: PAS-domain containing protein, partial [Proteobacteria bacterium]|nr:PAS-domain containing protein [Pseudomonadota bacterium]